jgi:hypothetical protein
MGADKHERRVGGWCSAAVWLVAFSTVACGDGTGTGGPIAAPTDAASSEKPDSQAGGPVSGADAASIVDGGAPKIAVDDASTAVSDGAQVSSDAGPADSEPGDADADAAPNEAGLTQSDNPCAVDNTDPSLASPYVLGTAFNGCVRNYADSNYISFTTPSNPAGGYVVVSFTAPASFNTGLTVDSFLYLASNTMIAYDVFEMHAEHPGDSLTYWFAAAPSTSYVMRVADLFEDAVLYTYTFSATYTPVDDPTKPNSTEGTATMVTLGTPVQSYEFHGYTSSDNSADPGWSCYFEADLAATPATVEVTNVPAEFYMEAYVFGDYSSGEASILGYGESGGDGQSFTVTTDQTFNAGPHYIRVEATYNPNAYGMGSTPASYLLQPYTLVVTQ